MAPAKAFGVWFRYSRAALRRAPEGRFEYLITVRAVAGAASVPRDAALSVDADPTVLVLNDPHVGAVTEKGQDAGLAAIDRTFDRVEWDDREIDLVVGLGDLAQYSPRGRRAGDARARDATRLAMVGRRVRERTDAPFVAVPGNHDVKRLSPPEVVDTLGADNPGGDASFVVEAVGQESGEATQRLVGLDTTVESARGDAPVGGRISAEEADRLAAVAAPDGDDRVPTFVFGHHPLPTDELRSALGSTHPYYGDQDVVEQADGISGRMDEAFTGGGERLLDRLENDRGSRVAAAVFGHIHQLTAGVDGDADAPFVTLSGDYDPAVQRGEADPSRTAGAGLDIDGAAWTLHDLRTDKTIESSTFERAAGGNGETPGR